MGQLDGKVAIVTGATSGIGERIAEIFVAEGANVVAAGRRVAEGKALEARCGDALSFIRTDVAIEADVRAMIDHAIARFGRLDCLVNNAGTGAPMVSITEVTEAQFNNVFSVNVLGVMFCIKYATPIMLRQGSGSIITIASAAGRRGGLGGHVYGGSKAAAIQLTRSAAAELGEGGIRLNSISPGGIVTGIFTKSAGVSGGDADRVLEVVANRFATLQPIPRAGVTDDVANAAVFLASDASSFITGQDLAVCGGLIPFGKFGWNESVELRADLNRQVRAELAKVNDGQ
jgi:NAD(P)-dependent dehydrogenase (short-subunit alcohol dehydrogenase family)